MGFQPIFGETITVNFVTSAVDGGVVDATGLPTCEVLEDAGDTAILTPTVVKRTGKTGAYRVTIPLSSGNGFEIGKCYNIMVFATIAGKSASGRIEWFVLRAYSTDGVNVLDIDGEPAVVDPNPVGALTPAERIEVAKAVKIQTGSDTVSGSLGFQSKAMYDTMAQYGGSQITGKVDPAPTPTTTAFKVTLDAPLAAAKTAAGISGQFCTIRAGGAQTEGNPIATCTIHSLTSITLNFTGTAIFSAAPVANDPISISE